MFDAKTQPAITPGAEVENKVDTNVNVSETELGIGNDSVERLDPKAEAALTRRFDCFLIPILGVSWHRIHARRTPRCSSL